MKINKLLGVMLLLSLATQVYSAGWKGGGDYQICDDIIDNGGDIGEGGVYQNSGSFACFVSSWAVISSSDVYGGFLPNINYVCEVTSQTSPADNTWFTCSTPTVSWDYFDSDNPQGGYQVLLSTSAGFTETSYDSGDVSENSENHKIDGIASGQYYWKVKVRDNPWDEWSVWSSTRRLNVDVDAPSGQSISLNVHTSSITYAISGSTHITVSGLHENAYWVEWSKDSFVTIYDNSGWISSNTSSAVTPDDLDSNTT